MNRISDVEIAKEYLRLKGVNEDTIETEYALLIPFVQSARREEPRINCGGHLLDYTMICDEDDTFDSFYGKDYFKRD